MQERLNAYLFKIKEMQEGDREQTFRPHLFELLESVAKQYDKKINSIHEPNNDKEGRGAPDFLITKDSLTLGYIETKRVNADLEKIAQSKQIQKYFLLSSNIILTDYLRFCLLHQDENGVISIKQECRICELLELQALVKNPKLYDMELKAKELNNLFTLFFSQNPNPLNTAKDFTKALAQRTRILKDEMIENEINASIQVLLNAFRESLYRDLKFIIFADSFAQTLTYSLFLARLNNNTEVKITLDNAYNFIPKSFPLIQAMSKFLRELNELDSIKWLLEEMIAIINHIDIRAIIQDLNKVSQKDLLGEFMYKDPYLHLYEDFLANYDSTLRELRGVYYTPAPVVRFIIDSIDLILQKDFNKQGLKSAITDESITLLDFATGTGTFLLEAFRKALETSDKSTPSFMLKPLLERFYGFEFLIAPYTIAHLKISQVLKEEFGIELKSNDKGCDSLNITLTNTLYFNDNRQKPLPLFEELTKEFEKAQTIKNKEILIITGNPPYSGASANKGLYEDEVRSTYGLEPSLATLSATQLDKMKAYFDAKIKMPQEPEALKAWHKSNACILSTFKEILKCRKLKDNPYKLEKLLEEHNFTGILENGRLKSLEELLEKHNIKGEKTSKWLLDDYVKFIRFAESKIQRQGSGVFAFISNNSFLDNPTFRGMRYYLLKTFDKIYILNLHGNARKAETTPSGTKDDNVFDIQQGVSINIFIKTKKDSNNFAKLHHYDVYGKRKEKYGFLSSNHIESVKWQILKPQSPFYNFIPFNAKMKKEWSVKDIFRVSNTGVVTKRDNLCIQKTKEKMWEAMQDIINLEKHIFYKKYKLPPDVRDWRYEWARQDVLNNNDKSKIQKIHYRPFDMRYMFYSAKSRGFVGWPVPIVSEKFLQDFENVGLVCYRRCGANGLDNIFIANGLIDLHLVGSGSNIFPLYDLKKQENLSVEFRKFIDKHYKEHFTPEQILGYIYAILFHKEYREKYLDFLKIDFPKIPFVKSKEKFLALSTLGNSLITLHLLQDNALDFSIGCLRKISKKESQIIEKSHYMMESKRLFINNDLYFDNVDCSVWEYKIGGYAVLDKYLKSHKGEAIDYIYFQKIIQTLHKSLELESKITEIEIKD
ncbi:type ISP restriction/modification enzyme [Helicobacter sp.]|uniref:type ISP restriction/modification enzyme n=1 Tax=Helicobacter sp. TaxID=218 RepID=UPI0025BFB2C4|nr:type ISP restriction/modification enzyme [Helicobacter sp.]MCI5968646.1 N-6 DNA methylase [Helicobacter sp.]MDY2584469.1 type ISP restriction/modification enzyme [Helicobacter sp.]